MTVNVPGWTQLTSQPAVLVKEYSFGAGHATAMAVLLADRKWLLVSPPTTLSEAEAKAFREHGEIVALLANNGAHHMGLGPCRTLFPNALTYASERAGARIRKKGKDPGPLEPIEKLSPLLGPKVHVISVAGDKIGDVVVRVDSDKGSVLYVSDFIANIQKLPSFVARLIFKLSDSGPGLKVFRLFFRFFVTDRKAARDALIQELEAHPPAILVPAHGEVIERAGLGGELVGMLRTVS